LVGQKAPGMKMSDRHEQSVLMTLKEAAIYLRVSKAHLSNLINGSVREVLAPCRSCTSNRVGETNEFEGVLGSELEDAGAS
jgi:hypothetical protein